MFGDIAVDRVAVRAMSEPTQEKVGTVRIRMYGSYCVPCQVDGFCRAGVEASGGECRQKSGRGYICMATLNPSDNLTHARSEGSQCSVCTNLVGLLDRRPSSLTGDPCSPERKPRNSQAQQHSIYSWTTDLKSPGFRRTSRVLLSSMPTYKCKLFPAPLRARSVRCL